MWRIANGFADAGVDVEVLTENRIDAAPVETVRPNLTVHRFSPPRPGRLWRLRAGLHVNWWRQVIRRQGRRGQLWASDPITAAGAVLAGRRGELIFNPACCAAAVDRVARAYPHVAPLRIGRLLQDIDRFAYRRAAHIVVSSQNVATQLADCYGQRDEVHIMPHGVDAPTAGVVDRLAARHHLRLPADAFVVGYVGRLDPCKDLGFLFEAATAGGIGDNDRIVLVGDGPDRPRLAELAARFQLARRIRWIGHVDDPSITYAAMDVMVLPSVYEAFGNVIAEAMAAGVPVLGRRRSDDAHRPVLTANDELIRTGTTGLLIHPHDPHDLGAKLATLRRFPALVQSMGNNARRAAQTHTWESVIQLYLDLAGLSSPQTLRRAA